MNKIVAAAVLCAGFAANVSASASNEITVRNALKETFYVAVSSANNKDAQATKPIKKPIKREKTVNFKPSGKNFVLISLYKDSGYKNPKLQRWVDLNAARSFGNARDIRIEGTSEMPILYSGDEELKAAQ